jgi:hypothetical protein
LKKAFDDNHTSKYNYIINLDTRELKQTYAARENCSKWQVSLVIHQSRWTTLGLDLVFEEIALPDVTRGQRMPKNNHCMPLRILGFVLLATFWVPWQNVLL